MYATDNGFVCFDISLDIWTWNAQTVQDGLSINHIVE